MEGNATYTPNTFEMLGGLEGVRALADCFYDLMDEIPQYRKIREMHPRNLGQTRENLTLFLSGWLGGPPLYLQKHGSVNLTELHAHLEIGIIEGETWLACMEEALNSQNIPEDLKTQLLQRFRVPAEKIRVTCKERREGLPLFSNDNIKK